MGSDKEAGILGIKNRTENWKTARHLKDLERHRVQLVKRLSGKEHPKASIQVELFWKGMRDWVHQPEGKSTRNIQDRKEKMIRDAGEYYRKKFSDLRDRIKEKSTGLKKLQVSDGKYNSSIRNDEKRFIELRNTEIDIVLRSPGHLFIGEAKHEMDLGANGNLILVHQLIRQYVMASILIELVPRKRGDRKLRIVPFLVVDSPDKTRETEQVKFMIKQKWLRKNNILSWSELNKPLAGKQT